MELGTPEVERWPAKPDLFTVKFRGPTHWSREAQAECTRQLEVLGVEEASYTGDFLTLYGVRAGQEADVYRVVTEVNEAENLRRAKEREEHERQRPEYEARVAERQAELDRVQEAF